jgi:hypothetical protein
MYSIGAWESPDNLMFIESGVMSGGRFQNILLPSPEQAPAGAPAHGALRYGLTEGCGGKRGPAGGGELQDQLPPIRLKGLAAKTFDSDLRRRPQIRSRNQT